MAEKADGEKKGRGSNKLKQPSFGRLAKGLAKVGQRISKIDFDATTGRYTIAIRSGGAETELTELTENEWEKFIRDETAKRKAT